MGTEPTQPKTLVCSAECSNPVFYTLEADFSNLRLVSFDPSLDWALFVAYNRGLLEDFASTPFYARYRDLRQDADVFFGKIADDRIFKSMMRFFSGELTAECLLEALQALNLGTQYCAVSSTACAAIRIVDEHRLGRGEIEKFAAQADRQHMRAVQMTETIVKSHRHQAGRYLDEILARMAEEGADRP